MASEQARDLRQRGIAAAKAGQRDEARQLLQQSIRLDANNEAAWLWLASVARDGRERVFCLQKLLEINPNHQVAREALQSIQGEQQPQQSGPTIRPIAGLKSLSTQPTEEDLSSQTAGVPIPTPDRIAEAQKQAEAIVREYMAQSTADSVKWVKKTRRRAGERDIVYLRAQVATAVVAFLAVVGVLGAVFVLNNAEARAILFAPTWTPTFTPTFTPTSTPGVTPTPSPTPALTYTPSPTIPPDIPTSDPYVPPRPTEPYPRVESIQLRNALGLVNQGAIETALPTLQAEREAVRDLFNASPYYFEALALAKAGNADRALSLLEDAEGQLNANNTNEYKPIIDAGYATIYAQLAEEAFARGQSADGRAYAEQARERALAAIDADPRNAEAHLALAESFRLEGDYTQALQTLDAALALPDLRTNLNLIVEKARTYYAQGELDRALHEAYVALYIDPATEPAHLLNIEIALRENDPGLAVIYAQNYLFYYPGSTLGWKLLGDARRMENKDNLALEAYSQALTAEDVTPATVDALVARAEVYEAQGRYNLARDDYAQAFEISNDPAIRARRMQAAYQAGNYATALEDAEALLGREVIPDNEINLLRARVLIDQASEDDASAYQQAAGLLAATTDLSQADQAIANEYFARAQYMLGNYETALSAVDRALALGETGYRRYLRGLILDDQGENEAAAREYEWVLAWSQVYPFSFRVDAQERLDAIRT